MAGNVSLTFLGLRLYLLFFSFLTKGGLEPVEYRR